MEIVLKVFMKVSGIIIATIGFLSSTVPGYGHYLWLGLGCGAILWFGLDIASYLNAPSKKPL